VTAQVWTLIALLAGGQLTIMAALFTLRGGLSALHGDVSDLRGELREFRGEVRGELTVIGHRLDRLSMC
jgi:hypothetical protein